ncbi:hypothetical protein BCON_0159g00210 [Botryotinia convoluta]|uniref:Uncharacterized protein n=1 Tax=Botryotinia convoluta TaxID=54673 RepID=A0A4Z1I3J3_9HELO|nr:hypothetical protein BCON_0159g00210 [Botryotinia convoluta]
MSPALKLLMEEFPLRKDTSCGSSNKEHSSETLLGIESAEDAPWADEPSLQETMADDPALEETIAEIRYIVTTIELR